MRLLLAANNQATRRNEIIKSYLQLGSSSNRYAPRLPQQETKSSTKQLPPTDPILGPENLLKTGFAQKGLPSIRYTLAMFFRKFLRFSGYSSPSSSTIRSALWENAHPSLAAVGVLLATAGVCLVLRDGLKKANSQHQKTVTNCICTPKQHS